MPARGVCSIFTGGGDDMVDGLRSNMPGNRGFDPLDWAPATLKLALKAGRELARPTAKAQSPFG